MSNNSFPTAPSNYQVLDLSTLATNPKCKHGPAVLFDNGAKQFYACSACRDHKQCNFYALRSSSSGKTFTAEKVAFWEELYKQSRAQYTQFRASQKRRVSAATRLTSTAQPRWEFCQTCGTFSEDVPSADSEHNTHEMVMIDEAMLKKPIETVLQPLVLKTTNAVLSLALHLTYILIFKILTSHLFLSDSKC